MSPTLEKVLTPPAARHQKTPAEGAATKLSIAVVFTSVESTLEALKEAGKLACSLNARITLMVPQVVPFPLPLASPPVLLDFNERRFRVIADQSPVETMVQIYLCRDRDETLQNVLPPRSVVVVAGPKRWWPTSEKRLARRLRQGGHEVFLVER